MVKKSANLPGSQGQTDMTFFAPGPSRPPVAAEGAVKVGESSPSTPVSISPPKPSGWLEKILVHEQEFIDLIREINKFRRTEFQAPVEGTAMAKIEEKFQQLNSTAEMWYESRENLAKKTKKIHHQQQELEKHRQAESTKTEQVINIVREFNNQFNETVITIFDTLIKIEDLKKEIPRLIEAVENRKVIAEKFQKYNRSPANLPLSKSSVVSRPQKTSLHKADNQASPKTAESTIEALASPSSFAKSIENICRRYNRRF